MKKVILAGLLLLSGYTVSAQAVVHYAWPIGYFANPEASGWHDHTAQCGYLSNSGTSTGAHLHFELWANQSIRQHIDAFGGAYSGLVYWDSQNENGYGKPSFRCE